MTERVLNDHDPSGELLVSSAGMLHYDVPLRLWLHRGGACRVYLHIPMERWSPLQREQYQWLFNHPGIDVRPVGGRISAVTDRKRSGEPSALLDRDRRVLADADVVEVGCVTQKGRMRRLIQDMRGRSQKIIYRRLTREEKRAPGVLPLPRYDALPPMRGFDQYLWHFTRSRAAPWPGETQAMYVDDLLGLRNHAPYTAADALERIITRGRIEPGQILIRGNHPVVSFTGAGWAAICAWFTWQSHLRRLRFEPFAVGILRDEAEAQGIQPVIYGDSRQYDGLPDTERWRFQNTGRTGDWIAEDEWRHYGPVNLRILRTAHLRILTPAGIQPVY